MTSGKTEVSMLITIIFIYCHTSHVTHHTSHATHHKSHTADVESVSVRPDMILSVVPTRDFDIGVSSSDNPEDSLISLFEK